MESVAAQCAAVLKIVILKKTKTNQQSSTLKRPCVAIEKGIFDFSQIACIEGNVY